METQASIVRHFFHGLSWKATFVQGIIAIIFGAIFIFKPFSALTILTVMIGAFFCASGILTLATGLKITHGRMAAIIYGLFSIIAGLLVFMQPWLAEMVIILMIGVWAIMTGVGQIMLSLHSKISASPARWLIGFSGLCSLIFGIILIMRPGVGLLAVALIIGIYLMMFGFFLVSLAGLTRKLAKSGDAASE
ncbi:MAG: DUF308 domain-containing protein [Victivallaceae bacterium]